MSDEAGQAPTTEPSLGEALRAQRTGKPEGQAPTSESGSGQTPPQQTHGTNDPPPEGKQFDAAYVHSLRQEAARHRTELQAERQKVADFEAQQLTEQQKLEKRAAKAEAERDSAMSSLVKYEVMTAKKIPAEAANLLHGSTREELESNADTLLQLIGQAPPTPVAPPDFGAGARPNGSGDHEDFSSILRQAAGRPA